MFKSLDEILDDLMRGLEIDGGERLGGVKPTLAPPMRETSEGQPHAIETEKKDGELNPRQVREEVKYTSGITQVAYLNRGRMPPALDYMPRPKQTD